MDTLVQIRLVGRTEQADFLASLLLGAGAQGLEVIDEDTMGQPTNEVEFRVYHPMETVSDALAHYKRLLPNDVQITTKILDPSWRDAIEHAEITLGQRFVINGCSASQGSRTSIELSLGYGFGDGRHSTTQASVCAMEALWDSQHEPQTVLDLGTGSGVLALVAAHLGSVVTAVDIEAISRSASAHHASINGLSHLITVKDEVPTNTRYDLVVANLYFPTLLSLADDFADWLSPGGRCILSGITAKGIKPVRERFEALGFKHRAAHQIDEWVAWTAQLGE